MALPTGTFYNNHIIYDGELFLHAGQSRIKITLAIAALIIRGCGSMLQFLRWAFCFTLSSSTTPSPNRTTLGIYSCVLLHSCLLSPFNQTDMFRKGSTLWLLVQESVGFVLPKFSLPISRRSLLSTGISLFFSPSYVNSVPQTIRDELDFENPNPRSGVPHGRQVNLSPSRLSISKLSS